MPGTVSMAAEEAARAGEAGAAEAPGATRADGAADAGCALQSKARSTRAATLAGRRKDGFSFKSEAPGSSPHSQRLALRSDDTASPTCDLALDRVAGAGDDQVDAGPAGGDAGPARIAVHAIGGTERAAVVQERRADELLVDGERERRVGGTGVRADLGIAEALLAQHLREVALGGAVVLADRVHAHGRRGPLAVELGGDLGQAALIPAVIADQDDVAKAGLAKAPRRALERRLECIFGDADR